MKSLVDLSRNYEDLGNAVVVQAVRDYRYGKGILKKKNMGGG